MERNSDFKPGSLVFFKIINNTYTGDGFLVGSTWDLEYDEDDPEFYKGDREVLDFYDQPGMGPLEENDGN